MSKMREAVDRRLGMNGRGIFVVPCGMVALLWQIGIGLRALGSEEIARGIAEGGSLRLWAVVAVVIAATAFALTLFVGAGRMLWQARFIVQRIVVDDSVSVKPYLGRRYRAPFSDVQSFGSAGKDRHWTLVTLLSRESDNLFLSLAGKGRFFINGDLEGAEEVVDALTAPANHTVAEP